MGNQEFSEFDFFFLKFVKTRKKMSVRRKPVSYTGPNETVHDASTKESCESMQGNMEKYASNNGQTQSIYLDMKDEIDNKKEGLNPRADAFLARISQNHHKETLVHYSKPPTPPSSEISHSSADMQSHLESHSYRKETANATTAYKKISRSALPSEWKKNPNLIQANTTARDPNSQQSKDPGDLVQKWKFKVDYLTKNVKALEAQLEALGVRPGKLISCFLF